jgi:hypothetical protein
MGSLSDDLRDMGFMPTGEESPVDEDGQLWSKGHEIICGKTGVIIDGNHHDDEDIEENEEIETRCGERVYRYRNSGRVKLVGGYTGSYDWGNSDDGFTY